MNDNDDERSSRIEYDRDQEPLVISKQITDLLLAQPKPMDLLSLFWFYYQTAKWQGTMQPRATNGYVANGLGIPPLRVARGTKRLMELGLLRRLVKRDENKQIVGHYVRLYLLPNGQATVSKTHNMAFQHANTRSRIVDKDLLYARSAQARFDPTDLPPLLQKDKAVRTAWKEFVEYRRNVRRKPISECAWTRLMREAVNFTCEEIADGLNTAMKSDWQAPHFRKKISYEITGKKRVILVKPPAVIAVQVRQVALLVPDADQSQVIAAVSGIKQFYDSIPTKKGDDVPNATFKKFFNDWVSFVHERASGKLSLTVFHFSMKGFLWPDFLYKEQMALGVNFKTGRRAQ